MNSRSCCMLLALWDFRAGKYSSCMLALLRPNQLMKRAIKYLRILVALILVLCRSTDAWAAQTPDSAQAKAKLAAVRARIAALTDRLALELKQRDALNARLRDADLEVTEKRRRLEALHAAELSV